MNLEYQNPEILNSGSNRIHGAFEISNEAYHSGPGVSKSMLDALDRSPAHYWAAYLDPERPPRESADHFDVGSAVHALVLEPEIFEQEFVIAPRINRRTKAGREEWAEFVAAHQGMTLLTQEQHDEARRMADSVLKDPLGRQLFQGGLREKSFYWNDEETGLLCRVRPDYLRPDVLVDLKTTKDASTAGFAKAVANYRYFVQDPFYCHGVQEATDGAIAPEYMIFVAVEKTPPYACNTFVLDEAARREGMQAWRDNLNTLKSCLENNRWPGYGSTIKMLSLPAWYTAQRHTKPDAFEWHEPAETAETPFDNDFMLTI